MGLYKYVKNVWKDQNPEFLQFHRKRLAEWRKQDSTFRVDKPTRIDRARSLGYRAKQGFVIVRQRVERGGRQRPSIRSGRRTAHNYQKKNLSLNYQSVAEHRANEKYLNCEVLNSYFVGQDAIYEWYEVILIDKNHPQILNDLNLRNVAKRSGRTYRGLTSAGRKSRGLRNKGFGAEKMRPSIKAHDGRGN